MRDELAHAPVGEKNRIVLPERLLFGEVECRRFSILRPVKVACPYDMLIDKRQYKRIHEDWAELDRKSVV